MTTLGPICVVGGGLAAGRAAEGLRTLGFEGELTVFTEEPSLPYERPPLSKAYLRGELGSERLLTRPAAYYEQQDIRVRTGTRVAAIDRERHRLRLANGEEAPYRRLLLATGSRAARPRLPGSHLDGVETLRTLGDAERLQAAVREGGRVLIVGGGFLGCELAASLRSMGAEVLVLEAGSLPLAQMGEMVGSLAVQRHAAHGVEIACGVTATELSGGSRLEAATLSDGRRWSCELAVLSTGAEPRVELALEAGLDVGDGILVDTRCATSDSDIFAAGDVAGFWHPELGHRLRLEHWDNAQLQGQHAAGAMLGDPAAYSPLPYFWTEQYDLLVQQVGLLGRELPLVVRGDPRSGRFSIFQMEGRRVTACLAINRYPDLKQGRRLIQNRIEVKPQDLADLEVDLKAVGG